MKQNQTANPEVDDGSAWFVFKQIFRDKKAWPGFSLLVFFVVGLVYVFYRTLIG